MLYTDVTSGLYAGLTVDPTSDDAFGTYLPRIIEGAELRCYRDLDLLYTRKTATQTIALGTSTFSLPVDWLIGRLMAIYATGTTKRVYLDRRDDSFIREYWPDPSVTSGANPPKYWTETTNGTAFIGPSADQAYSVDLSYTYRPAAMSAANPSTILGTNFPDLFFAATMLEGAAYQKNFGAASDDPRMAMSWKTTYDERLEGALREEARRKGEGYFDASRSAPPDSTKTRGG
jgi:hypothetical protein